MATILRQVQPCGDEARTETRVRVALPAVMTTRNGTRRVRLIDISARGARVQGDLPYRTGEEVLLQWGRFEAHGAVWWYSDEDCGIQFFDPVPAADLLATRDLGQGGCAPAERELVRRTAEAIATGRLRL